MVRETDGLEIKKKREERDSRIIEFFKREFEDNGDRITKLSDGSIAYGQWSKSGSSRTYTPYVLIRPWNRTIEVYGSQYMGPARKLAVEEEQFGRRDEPEWTIEKHFKEPQRIDPTITATID